MAVLRPHLALTVSDVERARQQLSPAFEALFDGALVQAHEQLVDEIRGFALDGLTRRLDVIGVPLASL